MLVNMIIIIKPHVSLMKLFQTLYNLINLL